MTDAVERLCTAAMSGPATRGGDAACFQITLGSLVIDMLTSCIQGGVIRDSVQR